MAVNNDTRGWILTSISAAACIFGALFICIDIVIRKIPGYRSFKIQDSNIFLSCSLSLSAGVMLFSALYKMLPSSKDALEDGGLGARSASWVLVGCFLGGALGIMVASNIIHRFIPSHTVACDHDHSDYSEGEEERKAGGVYSSSSSAEENDEDESDEAMPADNGAHRNGALYPSEGSTMTERSPLLSRAQTIDAARPSARLPFKNVNEPRKSQSSSPAPTSDNEGTLPSRMTRTISQLVTGSRNCCEPESVAASKCFGYSDPCGPDCFRKVNARGGIRATQLPALKATKTRPELPSMNTSPDTQTPASRPTPKLAVQKPSRLRTTPDIRSPLIEVDEEAESPSSSPSGPREAQVSGALDPGRAPHGVTGNASDPELAAVDDNEEQESSFDSHGSSLAHQHDEHAHEHSHAQHTHKSDQPQRPCTSSSAQHHHHHHHIPTNAFLSLSFQTTIAIALHKIPEGFITYATNHANPQLGLAVFLALAIHNCTEGFALALPIYLASGSRLKSLLISAVLGGASQPLGAGIAALWLAIAERGKSDDNLAGDTTDVVYGIMFAVTAGIMASVALSLVHQGLEMGHSKGLAMVFVFLGMGVMGAGNALTA